MTHEMAHADNPAYYFLVTEGWAITLLVLLYVVWVYTLPKAAPLARLGVPFVISLAAHLVMQALHAHMSVLRCISDIGYDWLAPIGIYHIAKEIIQNVKSNRRER